MTNEEAIELIEELKDELKAALENEECDEGVEYAVEQLEELAHNLGNG